MTLWKLCVVGRALPLQSATERLHLLDTTQSLTLKATIVGFLDGLGHGALAPDTGYYTCSIAIPITEMYHIPPS